LEKAVSVQRCASVIAAFLPGRRPTKRWANAQIVVFAAALADFVPNIKAL
jgi:hypothetical protein